MVKIPENYLVKYHLYIIFAVSKLFDLPIGLCNVY